MVSKNVRQRGTAALGTGCALAAAALLTSGPAVADSGPPPPLPVFTPGPSDWSPHSEIWPYSTFTEKVTPEMISGMSDSCQWFAAQFDPLMGQINDVNRVLGDNHDVYSGVQSQVNAVVANIDQSTGFLAPRLQPLTIRNTPDNFGPYSPIYGGEQMTSVLFQLSSIADSMKRKEPSGVTHAHIVHAAGWGNALRDSGACN
nr:hypothetical protein [Mycobacterium eburneum]